MNLFVIAGFLGPQEIILIVLALLLLFGGRKIPELMKGLGKGMKEFKKAKEEMDEEDNTSSKEKIEK
ncbi:MAG TPA: twin-arginine translocase TatA/TatE family subunit [Draconibacterium sp.]|nr:twin-arginine translocase TatA/TatE family subunit [Draconibacterium sp.]